MIEEWACSRLKSTLERVADARDDLVGRRLITGLRGSERSLGLADMLFALGTKLLDQSGAIAFKPLIGGSRAAGSTICIISCQVSRNSI